MMNYILHMQNFHYIVERDNRLKPWHITLYIALFNTWHKYHFTPVFRISRDLLMNASRISYKNTFAQTLKQLHEYGYIIYQPELHKGDYPKVTVIGLTDHETVKKQLIFFPTGTEEVPAQVHNEKQLSKQCKTIESERHAQKYPTMQEILSWFDKEHANAETALAFFERYSANGWMISGQPIRKWQAVASKWLLIAKKTSNNEQQNPHRKNNKN